VGVIATFQKKEGLQSGSVSPRQGTQAQLGFEGGGAWKRSTDGPPENQEPWSGFNRLRGLMPAKFTMTRMHREATS